jgi:hypothetical protein
MVNLYVHAVVRGLPEGVLDDADFLDGVWRELPDSCISGCDDEVGITLSQFAWSRRRGVERQLGRIRTAMRALGFAGAHVELDEAVREGWRDDLRIVVGRAHRR